jgi:hypothetical protein
MSARTSTWVGVALVVAIVGFSFVPLPGVSTPSNGWALGLPVAATSLSPLRVGAMPFLYGSVLVGLATLVVGSWGAWPIERKVRLAGWLGFAIAGVTAWRDASVIVAYGEELGGFVDPGLASTIRVALSLLAGSAALWAAARWIENQEVGSGLVWVLAGESIAKLLADYAAAPVYAGGAVHFDVLTWIVSGALLAWALTSRRPPATPRAAQLVLPEPGIGFAVSWAVVALLGKITTTLLFQPELRLRVAPTWPSKMFGTPWGAVPDHPSYWIATAIFAALATAVFTFFILSSPGTRARWTPLLGAETPTALETARVGASARAAVFAGALVGLVIAASSFDRTLASPFVVVFALELIRNTKRSSTTSLPLRAFEPFAAEAELESLRSRGIDATLERDAAMRLVPGLGPLFAPSLRVPEADVSRAREALERHHAASPIEPERKGEPAVSPSSVAKPLLAALLWIAASSFPWVQAALTPPEPYAEPIALTVHRVDDDVDLFTFVDRTQLPGEVRLENAPLGPGRTEVRSFVHLEEREGAPSTAERTVASLVAPNVPAGRHLAWEDGRDADGQKTSRTFVLFDEVEVGGQHITNAECEPQQHDGQWVVALTLDATGAERFASATRRWIKRRLAIVADGRILSAPVIMSEIPGGQLTLSVGAFESSEETRDVACALAAGIRAGMGKRELSAR